MPTQDCLEMLNSPAVLVIAYMRDEHILKYLPIFKSEGVKDVYIALDAPREQALRKQQELMLINLIQHLSKYDFNVWLWHRKENLGPAVSVYTAIDWFFQFEAVGIILEDDLHFETDFFKFAKKCLSDLQEESQIWLISGNQFFENPDGHDSLRFSHYPLIWGWATWREKWSEIRTSITQEQNHSKGWLRSPRISYWSVGRRRALTGKVDAWDIPLVLPMWEKNKLCVLPPRNLVSNVGADSHSTHTASPEWPLMQQIEKIRITDEKYTLANLSDARLSDDLLNSEFYKVRLRHFFLPVYAPIIDFFRQEKFSESLVKRIDSVEIPKNRDPLDV